MYMRPADHPLEYYARSLANSYDVVFPTLLLMCGTPPKFPLHNEEFMQTFHRTLQEFVYNGTISTKDKYVEPIFEDFISWCRRHTHT